MKIKYTLLKIALVLSPLIVGELVGLLLHVNSDYGAGVIFISFLGITFIALTGLVTTFLTRKSSKPSYNSLMGFVVPAIIVCFYLVFMSFAAE
jgi:uncharacterized membrane protein YeaQ/YmgE (transglycosylase-associated protein family)